MTDQSPIEKQATVAASPENTEKIVEGVVGNMDKGLPTFVVKGGGLWELWATATEMSQYRLTRYRDYDDMCTDSLIASALELISDDACQFSSDRGLSIWPSEGSEKGWVQQALNDFQVDDNIWGWVHNTALWGDFFPRFILDKDSKSKSGFKFRSLDFSLHPAEVRRLDIDGRLAGFLLQEEHGKVTNHPPWEFVHFMLNSRPRFERHKLRIKGYKAEQAPTDFTPLRGEEGREVTATSLYGTSSLDPARHVYRVLKLLEQSLALARLNRSPLIRVFYVNTSGMTPKERKATLDELHHRFKENLSMDMRQNFYKSDYNPLSFNADLFIPVTDGVGQITAETLGGELNIKDIVDIDYQRNKLFAALRIPKAYLGFEECLRGSTKIRLANGSTPTIKEMVDHPESYLGKTVLTCSAEGDVSATRILHTKRTRENATFVRVHLDDGASFEVTPDHRCMMRDGTFEEAGRLTPGASLMPGYVRTPESGWDKGYPTVKNNRTKKWDALHRVVARALLGGVPKGCVVHHEDHNKSNGDESNLRILTRKEHFKEHEFLDLMCLAQGRSPEVHAKRDTSYTQTPEFRQKISEAMMGRIFTEEHKRRISEALKGKLNNPFGKGKLKFCTVLHQRKHQARANSKKIQDARNNHKVVRVEVLDVVEDAYDIGVESPNHTFLLDAGVFVHNSMPGSLGATTLVRLDIRYARSVKKVQRAAISGVTRLLEIKYAIDRGERPDPKKIAVEMETISGAEELDRMEAWSQKLNVAQQFLQVAAELDEKGAKTEPLIDYVFDQVLGLKDLVKKMEVGKLPPEGDGAEEKDKDESGKAPFSDLKSSASLKDDLVDLLKNEDFRPSDLNAVLREHNAEMFISKPPKPVLTSIGNSKRSDFSLPVTEETATKGSPLPDTYAFLEDVVREPLGEEKEEKEEKEPDELDLDLDSLTQEPGRPPGEED